MATVGKLVAVLEAHTLPFRKGLKSAGKDLMGFGRDIRKVVNASGKMAFAIGAAGAAAGAGFGLLVKKTINEGDEVAKMAKRTGVGVQALSELRFVAEQTGSNFADVEKSFRLMQRSIYDAGRGTKTTIDAFAALGLTLEDFQGLSPEDQFFKIAERLGETADATQRAGIAMTLFGRTGTNLLPMFGESKSNVAALRQQARDLGIVWTDAQAAMAEVANDAINRMSLSWDGLRREITLVVVPQVIKSLDTITAWINQHRADIVEKVEGVWGKLTPIVDRLGKGFTVMGAAASWAVSIVNVLVQSVRTLYSRIFQSDLVARSHIAGEEAGAARTEAGAFGQIAAQGGRGWAAVNQEYKRLSHFAIGTEEYDKSQVLADVLVQVDKAIADHARRVARGIASGPFDIKAWAQARGKANLRMASAFDLGAAELDAQLPKLADSLDGAVSAWGKLASAYDDLIRPVEEAAAQAAFASQPFGDAGDVAGVAAGAGAGPQMTTGAMMRGGAEAFSTLVKASQQAPSKPEVETAKNTGLSAESLAKIERALYSSRFAMSDPQMQLATIMGI